ncbi:MAG: hypothetical protein V4850_30935 [Myxococcota bacterium]
MIRLACVLPLFALAGCAGSVQLEELAPFGGAASAVWLHWDDSNYDSVVLTNVPNACAKWVAFAETTKDLAQEIDDFDQDDFCEESHDLTMAVARAGDALFHEGVHTLSLGVYEGGSTEPDEETYEVGDNKRSLSGTLTYYENSPYAAYLADWDVDEDRDDNCGVDYDDLETKTDQWTLDDGELEVGRLMDERSLSARLAGDLKDRDDDDDAGEIRASFTATWCEVDF